MKILFMDVDGTLTDGKIYIGSEGEIFKAFDIKDGYGIHDILIPNGILPVIITGRRSKILERRCQELGIEDLYQNVEDKVSVMERVRKEKGCMYENTAYIGDDINDLPCIEVLKRHHGLTGCPQDAVRAIQEAVDFVSTKRGGDGAVREFIEWMISKSSAFSG